MSTTSNPFFSVQPFTVWDYKNPLDNSDEDDDEAKKKEKLKKVETIVNFHTGSLIFYIILFGVYLGFSLGYETKLNHLIPISFDTGTFGSNHGSPFNNTLLISRSYTYQLWLPLIIMLSIIIVLQLYPILLYYYKKGQIRLLNRERRKRNKGINDNNNNNNNDNDEVLKTDFFYDMVTMGTNLHLWIEHAFVTGILLFVAAGVVGISNIILLLFFAIISLFIGVICLYTHELLSAGYVLNGYKSTSSEQSSSSSPFRYVMNWIPLFFGFILTLTYLGPFITYYSLSNLSTLGSSGWFVWTFGIGVISMIFIMNLIPLITYLYINYLISKPYSTTNNKNVKTLEGKTKQIQYTLYGYTIGKMVWLVLTVTFAVTTAFISIFV